MDRITSIADAKAKMEKSVKFYASRIEAWKKVTRLYKKDGGNFSVLSKNFSGCSFVNRFTINRVEVTFRDENGAWTTDDITIDANCYEEAADTPEKIADKIEMLIYKYEKWKAIDEKGLAEIEAQINAILPALEGIKKAIEEAKETNTHYTIQAYIKEYLRIL